MKKSFRSWKGSLGIVATLFLLAGCAVTTSQGPTADRGPAQSPQSGPAGQQASGKRAQIDPAQVERLKRIMVPLIEHMNKPIPLNKVQVGILDDDSINAANAGGGKFYVTRGLLEKANDEEMQGVLAHEVAHEDLGHVAKAQALGTGLNIGMIILDQIIPGSGALAPAVVDLGVMRPFTRSEEYQADAHGVDILNRTGQDGKKIMTDTLNWLLQSSGPSGGFLSTHPGTADRIKRVENMRS
ncbi:MAG TPA: M48 family metallopeptidase [Thermodesulfobacteriota bacterium]|nr:M48 family metallopeptidase [Thermodesulfobacteriota bacterium]